MRHRFGYGLTESFCMYLVVYLSWVWSGLHLRFLGCCSESALSIFRRSWCRPWSRSPCLSLWYWLCDPSAIHRVRRTNGPTLLFPLRHYCFPPISRGLSLFLASPFLLFPSPSLHLSLPSCCTLVGVSFFSFVRVPLCVLFVIIFIIIIVAGLVLVPFGNAL